MTLSFTRFLLLCKRQLKNPIFCILFFGFPFFGLLFSCFETYFNLPLENNKISIALYCENPDSFTEKCFRYLLTSSTSLDFYVTDSLSSLEGQVISQKADCGYVFPDNYQELLLDQNYQKAITVYTTSSTLFSHLSNEIVFASLFRFAVPDITISYMEKSSIFDSIRKEAIPIVTTQYTNYLEGNQADAPTPVFHLVYETLTIDGNLIPATISFFVPMPIRGISAILIFVSALSGACNYLEDKKRKLPLSSWLSIGIVPFLFTISAWFTLWIARIYTSFWKETLSSLLYLLLVILFAQAFIFICKKTFFITASIPFFLLGSTIFCPIFFDISSIMPIFDLLEKFFLPYYYLSFF